MSSDAENLLDFSKHVPAILRQQLLCELVTDYVIKRTNNHDQSADLEIRPSIQRFHGALLFVDIAGFTVLSQRLDVESLKNNINNYFTRMLGIIDKWGGDVVKFAGDALYVIWPMSTAQPNVSGFSSTKAGAAKKAVYQEEARRAVEKAANCGLEICSQCGRYEVFLGESNSGEKTSAIAATGILSKILPSWSFSSFITPKIAPINNSDSQLTPTVVSSSSAAATTAGAAAGAAVGATPSSNLTYLDVHCGLSVGLMAGIDIGYGDRWEYFLTGEPIASVAEAEGAADKGDVVMCAVSHRLLHVDGDPILDGHISAAAAPTAAADHGHSGGGHGASNDKALANVPCKCGCTRVPSGVFKLFQVAPKGVRASRRVSQTRTKTEQEVMSGELTAQDDKLGRAINDDLDMALVAATPLLQKHYFAAAEQYGYGSSSGRQRKESFKKSSVNAGSMNGSSAKHYSGQISDRSTSARVSADFSTRESLNSDEQEEREQAFEALMHGTLRDHFLNWTRSAMTLGTMYHTHEVARNDYVPAFHVVTGHYFNLLGDLFHGNADNSRQMIVKGIADKRVADSPHGRDSPALTLLNTTSIEDHPIEASTKYKPLPILSPDAAASAAAAANNSKYGAFKASTASELRSMTIMFINIIGLDIELTVDAEGNNHSREINKTKTVINNNKQQQTATHNQADSRNTKKNNASGNANNNKNNKCFNGAAAFGFLDRTDNESVADELLLKRLQGCIEVLGEAIYANGGQMRQFIVDDKGTVCIASFGLRGAVNVDNAAVAVEAAQRMITGLQENLGLSASIGITSGKAYSGTVGSPLRHEYAIMGPCVNLSARLMGKSTPNNMLCDTETVTRDRTHEYVKLSEVIAKGYAYPVGTFAPKKAGLQQGGQGTPSPNGSVKSAITSLKSVSLKSSSNLLRNNSNGSFGMRANAGGTSSKGSSIGSHIGNATASATTEPAYERLWRLTESDLFLPLTNDVSSLPSRIASSNELMSSQLPIQLRLHGRKDEVTTIFKALFTKRNLSGGVIFSLDDAARFIALSGAGGVGKSALVNSLAAKLTSMLRRDLSFNLLIFRNRGSSLHSVLPFTSWLPILGELCAAVHRSVHTVSTSAKQHNHHLHSPKGSNSLANEVARKAAAVAAGASSNTGGGGGGVARGWHAGSSFLSGLNAILQALPLEAQAQKSLLLDALGVTGLDSTDPLAKLDERQKLMICAELLAAIVSAASRLLKKMLLIIMEDVQTIDSWSFSVLYQLWSRGRGVVAILNVSTSVDYASHLITWATDTGIDEIDGDDGDDGIDDGADLIEHLFGRFDDERRFKVLEILPLTREATLQMARETLGFAYQSNLKNSASIKASHGQPALELNNIFEATGGNPLYTVELLKSFQHVRTSSNVLMPKTSAATMNHRVEEIICFRLDKLEGAQQIVLKAAAVAAANGRSFDADIISFILLEHDYFHADNAANDSHGGGGGGGGGGGHSKAEHGNGTRSSFFNAGHDDVESAIKQQQLLHVSNLPLIQAALEELAEHGEFVQCTEDTANLLSAMENSLSKSQKNNMQNDDHKYDDDDEEEFIPRYEFKIPMEKATIYGLIIDEQKQYFHERTALYCGQLLSSVARSSNSSSGTRKAHLAPQTPNSPYTPAGSNVNIAEDEKSEAALRGEEGYHWQYAGHWGFALRSYRKCGELRKQKQQYSSWLYCLQQAARMVQFMEEETGPALSPFDDTYALKRYENRLLEIVKYGGDALTFIDADEDLLRQIEPELETVRELFENDPSLLPLAASLYAELAFVQLLRFDDPLHIAFALGAALKLFVACSFWSQLGNNQDSHVIVDGPGEQMGLFLLTTAATTQLFHPPVTSSSAVSNRVLLPMTGLEMALDEVINLDFENASQQLQLLSIKIIRAMSSKKVDYAVSMLSEVKALRSNEGAVYDLVMSFDGDLSLIAIIQVTRYVALSQEVAHMEMTHELINTVIQGVLQCSHGLTLAWSIFLLTPLLSYLNRYEEALQLLDRHRTLTRQARHEAHGHSIGSEAIPPLLHEILRTWIYCLEDLAHRTNSTEQNNSNILTLNEGHLDEQVEFITVDHVERIIHLLETRAKGMTLAEDCSDGITAQLESLVDAAGCGLNHVLLDLTFHLASSPTLDTAAYAELQAVCCRRIDALSIVSDKTDTIGRALADLTMFTALQRALHASPSLPVALVKLRLADLLATEPMLVLIEHSMSGLKIGAKRYYTFGEEFLQMAPTHAQSLERMSKACS